MKISKITAKGKTNFNKPLYKGKIKLLAKNIITSETTFQIINEENETICFFQLMPEDFETLNK